MGVLAQAVEFFLAFSFFLNHKYNDTWRRPEGTVANAYNNQVDYASLNNKAYKNNNNNNNLSYKIFWHKFFFGHSLIINYWTPYWQMSIKQEIILSI